MDKNLSWQIVEVEPGSNAGYRLVIWEKLDNGAEQISAAWGSASRSLLEDIRERDFPHVPEKVVEEVHYSGRFSLHLDDFLHHRAAGLVDETLVTALQNMAKELDKVSENEHPAEADLTQLDKSFKKFLQDLAVVGASL